DPGLRGAAALRPGLVPSAPRAGEFVDGAHGGGPSAESVNGVPVLKGPPPWPTSPRERVGRSPLGVTTYHPSGCREPGLEPIRRVAGRYMADVAKNGRSRPGT